MDIAKRIGTRAKDRRVVLGKKQEEVAQAVGVKRNYLSYVENGKHVPGIQLLFELARVLDCTVSYLIGEDRIPATRTERENLVLRERLVEYQTTAKSLEQKLRQAKDALK